MTFKVKMHYIYSTMNIKKSRYKTVDQVQSTIYHMTFDKDRKNILDKLICQNKKFWYLVLH